MSAMSRKHYREVAAVLADGYAAAANDDERAKFAKVTFGLADVFKRDNLRFDRAKFYSAISPDLRPYA